jgi:hypothetical protein
VLWIRTHLLRIRIHTFFVPDSDLDSVSDLTQKFLKWCLFVFFMCSGICKTEEKVFQQKGLRFFSFKCLICDFSQNILFYKFVDPNPNFFFGFGSSQNIRSLSDSDPDNFSEYTVFSLLILNSLSYDK